MAQNYHAGAPIGRELYQLPGRINIQANSLPVHYIIYYQGIRVPQFATITQIPVFSNYEVFHPNFGPLYLPNDYPAVPYPAEAGMQWIGYLAPSPELPIPQNNAAYFINPYDINGRRGAPPHVPPQAPLVGFPPILSRPEMAHQQLAGRMVIPPRPQAPAPHLGPFNPPPYRLSPQNIIGTVAGGVHGLQNNLNAGEAIGAVAQAGGREESWSQLSRLRVRDSDDEVTSSEDEDEDMDEDEDIEEDIEEDIDEDLYEE